jgi:predicted alpha/beta-hydrolase family hydrolase
MEETFDTGGVRGVLHRPEAHSGDAIVLAHGAGSNHKAPLLVTLAKGFSEAGFLVLRYDLPYRMAGRPTPPPPASQASDREGILRAVGEVRKLAKGRIIAGGHSYGGRQTAMAAAEHPDLATGLMLFSYPLHPPRKPEQMRTAFFPELRTPAMFVHGTRDPFGSVEELRDAIRAIPAKTELLPVEGSGHELKGAARMMQSILGRMVFFGE